jgi:hypothetical protein
MKFVISKMQSVILFLCALAGAFIGYIASPSPIMCITYPCYSPSPILYAIMGFIITSVVVYFIEIIYNSLIKKS